MDWLPLTTVLAAACAAGELVAEATARRTGRWRTASMTAAALLSSVFALLGFLWWSAGQHALGAGLWGAAVLGVGLFTFKLLSPLGLRLTLSAGLFRGLATSDPAVVDYQVLPGDPDQPLARPRREHSAFSVQTDDGVTLRGTLIRSGHPCAVIIAHGAFRSMNTFPYVILAQWLAYKYDVVAFDFRGHGESGGWYDFSDKSALDVRAVVRHTRQLGYRRVGVFGRSMGAWSAVIAAGTNPAAADGSQMDSLVAAAAPLRYVTSISGVEGLQRITRTPIIGRLAQITLQLFVNITRGTRVSGIMEAAVCPLDAAPRIAIPVFLIYQEYDVVIQTGVAEARELLAALPGPKRLLILAGPGHIFELASFHRVCAAVESWFDETLGVEPGLEAESG